MRRLIFIAGWLVSGGTSFAQQAVQQPVVGSTSVSTTVSVPDRGRVFLGGVSSAQSGRTQYGPLGTGPALGLTRQSSSVSASVTIHDLRAMDEALLKSAPSVAEPNRPKADSRIANPVPEKLKETAESLAEKATRHEHLARKAEDEGRAGVARLHWQAAAKYGSKAAEERLATQRTNAKSVTFANTKSSGPSAHP